MFKIVMTVEKETKHLTIVPFAWECNGQLSWPKFRADNLIRIADSIPEDNWFKMRCKLKRNYLINYEVAEEELERMLDNDESEQEESMVVGTTEKTRRKFRVISPQRNIVDGFNSLEKTCVQSEQEVTLENTGIARKDNVIILEQPVFDANQSYQYEIPPSDENLNSLFKNIATLNISNEERGLSINSQTNHKLDKILANQAIILQNQNLIIEKFRNVGSSENQIAIMQQLTKFEAMFDVITSNQNKACSCKTNSPKTSGEDIDVMEPINTVEELTKLEEKLREKIKMDDYVKKLSYICGKKGRGNGLNNCYVLIDRIFSRKFMTLCSWTGGAREKKEKIPFKIFKNTIGLFYRIVHLADQDFTLRECEDFFKNVIRNSTRRSESSMIRTSQMKRRPKKLCYTYEVRENYQADSNAGTGCADNQEEIQKIEVHDCADTE